MIGQRSSIDPTVEFAGRIDDLKRRVAELERLAGAGPFIQSGEANGTTDGSGEFAVTFPIAFSSAPVVTMTTETANDRIPVLQSATTTGFVVAYFDIGAGAVAASASIAVNWIARGT